MAAEDGATSVAEAGTVSHDVDHAGALLDAVAARILAIRSEEPLAAITLLVDSASTGTMFRRQLVASGRCGAGVAGVSIRTITDLLADLAALAGLPGGPSTAPLLRTALVQKLLHEDAREFEAVKDHPSTPLRLSALVTETQWCAMDSETGARIGDAAGPTAAAVVNFVARARQALAEVLDEQPAGDIAEAVAARLSTDQVLRSAAARELGTVLVVPQVVPGPVRRLLEALSDSAGVHLFRLSHATDPVPTRILDVPDPGTEVALAVREVGAAIHRGTPPERVAIAYSTRAPYAELLATELAAAGIEWNGPEYVGLDASALARATLTLLEMARGRSTEASGITRSLLMRWLSVGWIGVDGESVPAAKLRRFIREQSLYGDSASWAPLLDTWAAREAEDAADSDRPAVASDADDDVDPAVALRIPPAAQLAQTANDMRDLLAALERAVAAIAAATSYSGVASATWAALQGFHLGWGVWGTDAVERHARQRLHDLLCQEIPALDELLRAPASTESVEAILEAVSTIIQSDLQRNYGWHGVMSCGVHVGPVTAMTGLHFDEVILVGAVEGLLPPVAHDDPLLPDTARAALRSDPDDLPLSTDGIDRCTRAYRSLLGGARTSVVIRPRGALPTAATNTPSRYLPSPSRSEPSTRIGSRRGSLGIETAGVDGPATGMPLPVTASDVGVLGLLRDPASADDQIAGLAAAEAAALFPAFDEYHGNVSAPDAAPVWDITERPISATAIETFLYCPHRFFVDRVLGVDCEEPGDEVEVIEPRHFGSLIHSALEALFTQAESEGWLPGAGQPWPRKAHEQLRACLDAAVDDARAQGLTGWEPSWQASYELVLATLQPLLDLDAAELRGIPALRPADAELVFGGADTPAVRVTTSADTAVDLRGAIDRLDLSEDGTVAGVVDFKSGRSSSFKTKLRESDRQKVQDLIYDQATRALFPEVDDVVVNFVFIPDGGKPTAVKAAVGIDREARLVGLLEAMESAGRQGEFPPAPKGSSDYCPVCARLGRRAERAASDHARGSGDGEPDVAATSASASAETPGGGGLGGAR